MLFKKNNKNLIHSCLSGYNFYKPYETIADAYGNIEKIRAVQDKSFTEVEIRYDDTLRKPGINKWKYFIEHPIDIKSMIWPVDLITQEERLGLVFRRRAFPKMNTFRDLLYREYQLDWRKEKIQTFAVNFLNLCQNIHEGDYAYHCFDLNRMYYNAENMDVLFDFSLSMTRNFNDPLRKGRVDKENTGIEFLSPWLKMDENNEMTFIDDCYSITALLFRMMIGRMPYHGRLMDGLGDLMNIERDVDYNEHINMIRHYREISIFIFDPEDTSNGIGTFSDEQEYIQRWNDLPETVKQMFISVFSQKNVECSIDEKIYYTPKQWLEALSKCFSLKGVAGK